MLFSEMEVQKRQHAHERQPILSPPGAPESPAPSSAPAPASGTQAKPKPEVQQ
jgi:hypothetical protein